ncbi:MAG: GNAT family N-acetyltransferase [Candidatus Kapaibacterium sp.]
MNSNLILRQALPDDLPDILQIFKESIEQSCAGDYTPRQIAAWVSSAEDRQFWLKRINEQYFILAEYEGRPAGFASLKGGGYIDLLYVHRDYQGMGVAGLLLKAVSSKAKSLNSGSLSADVSISAMPFFINNGFAIIRQNINYRQNVELINYRMERII